MNSRILIADDHPGVRRMLKLLVETQAGWEVCGEAENGLEAIASAADLKPDLIIMDLAMPVMDGIRASREIFSVMPTVPILMHTLHYSSELDLEAKKVGVRRVVAKAHGGDELISAIRTLLGESSSLIVSVVSAPEVAIATVNATIAAPQEDVSETCSSGADEEKWRKNA